MHRKCACPFCCGETQPFDAIPLTKREEDVLRLVAGGKTNQQIADMLGIAHCTTRNLMTKVLAKIGKERRSEAAIYAYQSGVIRNGP